MSITGPFAWKKTSRSERALSLSFRWFRSPRRSLQLLSMHKLLIVDDETGIRESLEGVLADEGYETASTESGEECLKLLRREHKPQISPLDDLPPPPERLRTPRKIPEITNTPSPYLSSNPPPHQN